MSEVHVTGLKELNTFLQQMPVKLQKNVVRGALRAGMNVVKPVAQSNIHSVSGLLAKSLRVSTNSKGGRVTAKLVAGRGFGAKGMPAKNLPLWVEFGTAAHSIPKMTKKMIALVFGGGIYKSVNHPGARRRPFMRPALDSEAGRAVVAAGEYIKKRLATKQGLDTAGIEISSEG
jgi:HK97 gp10 family phage protein